MFISLAHLSQLKAQITIVGKDGETSHTGPNMVFLKYWDLATAFLKLSVLNELIQTFRTTNSVLEPLLRVMLILSRTFDRSQEASAQSGEVERALTETLLKIVDRTLVVEEKPETESIVKTAIVDLFALQRI
jgi:hypothetical protein